MSARQVYCAHNVPFDRICSMCNPPRCVTCKHWDRVYDDIGVCERIHRYGYRESTPVWIGTDNVDDVADLGGPDLRTLATFGCTEWAAQEDQT